MINLNSDLISGPQTLARAAAAGVTKVAKDVSEQVDESSAYFGAATLQLIAYILYSFHAAVGMILLQNIILAILYLQRQ